MTTLSLGTVQCHGFPHYCSNSNMYCNVVKHKANISLTVRLSIGLQDLNVHRRVNPTQDLSGFVSTVLVTGVDGACLPVGPIQGLLRQC